MSEQEILNIYLLLLKSTVEVYVHGTLESSNSNMRNLLHDSLNSTLDSQSKVYDKMVDLGYYNVQNVKSSDISKTLSKLNAKK